MQVEILHNAATVVSGQCSAVQCHPHRTAHRTAQHSTVQYNAVQYNKEVRLRYTSVQYLLSKYSCNQSLLGGVKT
jgi:hypothetical protein